MSDPLAAHEARDVTRTVTIHVREVSCIGPGCDRWFKPNRRGHLYCSDACRQAAWRERHRSTRNVTRRYAVT